MPTRLGAVAVLAAMLWLSSSGSVRAQGESADARPPADEPDHELDCSSDCVAAVDPWVAVSLDVLADRRGGLALIADDAAIAGLGAEVSDNRVGDGVATGSVGLATGALSDVSGIFVGAFNTGNNSSIQTNLNVFIRIE